MDRRLLFGGSMFGQWLKERMTIYNITFAEVMGACAVSYVSVSKWRNNHTLPSVISFIYLIDLISEKSGETTEFIYLDISEQIKK